MPYSITTKDGITIQNIPDDIAPDSQVLKDRVAKLRSPQAQVQPQQVEASSSRPVELPAITQPEQPPAGSVSLFGISPSDIKGTANLASNIASSAIAQPVAGIAALPDVAAGEGQRGAEAVKEISSQIQTPLNQEGQEVAAKIGSVIEGLGDSPMFSGIVEQLKSAQSGLTKVLQNTGAFITDPLGTTEASIEGGRLTPQGEVGAAIGGALSEALPQTALEVAGFKGAGKIPKVLDKISDARRPALIAHQQASKNIAGEFSKLMSESDQAIAKLILDKSDDISTATKKLSSESLVSRLTDGLPRVVNDKLAKQAISAGLNEKAAAIIKASTPAEKANYLKMVKIANNALRSGTEEALNRTGQVVGKTLQNRVKVVGGLLKKFGKQIDQVAESELKGARLRDTSRIFNKFDASLNKLKISADDNFKRLDFSGSDIVEGVSGAKSAQNILKATLSKLNAAGSDPFKLHELKRFIDTQVKFGKTPSGSAGIAESALKDLRREINQALGDQFSNYRAANEKFKSALDSLNAFQDAAGAKLDLTGDFTDKALGTKLRSLTNNTAARTKILQSVADLEDVIVKNGGEIKDRIVEQTIIANELEQLLKISPKTGLQDLVTQGITDAAINTATTSPGMAAASTGRTIASKLGGKTPEKTLEAIKKLIEGVE